MKKILLPLMLAASVLLTASGCGSPQPDIQQTSEVEEYVGVCIDPETQDRVDDDYCEGDRPNYNPYFTPYFYPYGYMIPGIGLPVYGGYSTVSSPYRMGFSKTGGSSTGYTSSGKQYVPNGYTLPSNAVVKPAQPKATQAAPPAGLRTTPAPVRTNIPKVTAPNPAPKSVTIAPAPAVDPKKATTPDKSKPQNNYKAPDSGLKKSTTPKTTTKSKSK